MTWLNLTRVAAVLALMCFFTPWFAVSCQGTEILSATGLQLATGTVPQPPGSGAERSHGPEIWALLALLMLLGAAVMAAAFAKAEARLRVVAGLCGGAAVFLAAGMLLTVEGAKREMSSSSGARPGDMDAAMRQMAAQGIRIEVKFGYWLTLLLAAGASAAAWCAVTGRVMPRWALPEGLASGTAAPGVDMSRWTPPSFGGSADQRYWDGLKDKSDPDILEEYLTRFPEGQFAGLAKTRLARAGREAPDWIPVRSETGAAPAEPAPGEPVAVATSTAEAEPAPAMEEAAPADDAAPDPGCPACGAPAEPAARFCTECGLRLDQGGEP